MQSDATPSDRPLGRVAILGLGLMGGSLSRAITGLQIAERVTGWAPEATERDAALTAGAVTFAAVAWQDAVAEADLIVLAAPMRANLQLLRGLGEVAPDGATVTDLSGLKAPVLDVVREAGLLWRWVGSHPMAGVASTGFWASRDDLFEGARVWTVSEGAAEDARHYVDLLWSSVGAAPRPIEVQAHDRLMAIVSHLSQLAANALAEVVEQAGIDANDLGPGGRDMTRLAASDPQTWAELLDPASPALIGGLRGLAHAVERIADLLEEGDVQRVEALMGRTRRWRAPTTRGEPR